MSIRPSRHVTGSLQLQNTWSNNVHTLKHELKFLASTRSDANMAFLMFLPGL